MHSPRLSYFLIRRPSSNTVGLGLFLRPSCVQPTCAPVFNACPNTARKQSVSFYGFYGVSYHAIPEKTEISTANGVIFNAEEGTLAPDVQRRSSESMSSCSDGSGFAAREQNHVTTVVAKSSRLNPRPSTCTAHAVAVHAQP